MTSYVPPDGPLAAARAAIRQWGPQFNPDILERTRALYEPLIRSAPDVSCESDIPYGDHARQRLDVYRRPGGGTCPVVLFVPGGGFTGGDKRMTESFYGNLGRWFAQNGRVAVAMNYRLAPDHAWPAGAEDVAAAFGWVAAEIARYGGDPSNITIFGQSAGATHVATFLFHPDQRRPCPGLRGAVLASGVYRITPDHRAPNILAYFGDDLSALADRSPITHVGTSDVPILLSVAEFDPVPLGAPTYDLALALTRRDGRPAPVLWLEGHNHVSTVLSFGSGDEPLGRAILRVSDPAGRF